MHLVRRSSEYTLSAPAAYAGHSDGYLEASLVDRGSGSVHTGLSLNQLAPGGHILPHVHAYEESFYILDGEATVRVGDHVWRLGAGDYGVSKVGTVHAWSNHGSAPVRWLQMSAPQPKPAGAERDTFFVKDGLPPTGGERPVSGAALLGHFHVNDIPSNPDDRPATGGLKGVFLKWLVDEQFGARHQRLLLIEYLPGVSIARHDHTFEEGYFLLSGQVEATADGQRYTVMPGDVVWTGVGCVHSFANIGTEPVRWLETFAPQPPAENVFRFMAEWEQKGREIEG
jgi:quercetin dioxygenase-like cupin family protein